MLVAPQGALLKIDWGHFALRGVDQQACLFLAAQVVLDGILMSLILSPIQRPKTETTTSIVST